MSNRSTLLLEHHLKELRLPTFLREYRKLAAQCAAEGTDHPDYLLLSRVNHICRFSVNQFCRFTSSAWPRCWAASVR